MSDLWSDKNKEKLSDIDPDNFDEACDMAYNLHEDCLVLKEENAQLKTRIARLEDASNNLINVIPHMNGVFVRDCVEDLQEVLKESSQQSLVEIQADAAKVMIGSLKLEIRFGQGFIKVSDAYKYIEQLRNSIKDGE